MSWFCAILGNIHSSSVKMHRGGYGGEARRVLVRARSCPWLIRVRGLSRVGVGGESAEG